MGKSALETWRENVQNLDALPVMPAVLGPLLRCLELPPDELEIEKIAELIGRDKSMAAQCLRSANAALHARYRPVESIRGAVVSLGSTRLRGLVWASFLNRLAPREKWALDPVVFWKHSFGCALLSQRLARKLGFVDTERAYLCGLLHDIGEIVSGLLLPKEFDAAVREAREKHVPLFREEENSMGFTHCETGRVLADRWHLPAEAKEAIEFHHEPERSKGASAIVSIVNLSDLLCRMYGMGYGYDESWEMEFVSAPAWNLLQGTPDGIPKLPDASRLADELISELEEVEILASAAFGP